MRNTTNIKKYRFFISNVSKALDTVLHYHLLLDCSSAHLAKRVFVLLIVQIFKP